MPGHSFFMVKIFGFIKSDSGTDWYRIKQPLIHIKASKQAEVRFFNKGDDFDWFGTQAATDQLEEDLKWADCIFVPRVSEAGLTKVLTTFQTMGKKIFTDWDDNFMHVSPFTQQYREFGIEEYSHDLNGEKLEVWKDGKNIDLALNREKQVFMRDALKMADVTFATTEELGKAFTAIGANVVVTPNSVNTNLWKKLPLQSHRGVRMGWFGGDTHYNDWLLIAPVLKQFMEENPNVTLVLLGAKFDGTLKGIEPQRIEHHHWTDIQAYPYKAAILDLDFAVIPLVDNEFNRGKSPVKWLEMGALEVPSITSYVKPYDELMDMVKDNGIFVENNSPQGWYDAMNLMMNSATLRKRMGIAARQTVEQNYDANLTWKIWLKAFEDSIVAKPTPLEVI